MNDIKKSLEDLFDDMIKNIQFFKKTSYHSVFKEKYEENRELFLSLSSFVDAAEESKKDRIIKELATVIPDYARGKLASLSKRQKEISAIDYNMTIVVYIIPMLLYDHHPVNEAIADQLVSIWNETKVTGMEVKKETFESMNKVIDESKKIREIQPKLQTVFDKVDGYANSYKYLEKENFRYKKEIDNLESKNNDLEMRNNSLLNRIYYVFQMLKKFLRKLLQRGNDYTKDETSKFIKNCYDEQEFDMNDVVGISRGTTKQDELFDYVEAPDYLKSRVKDYDEYEKDKDDFEMSL